MNALNDNLEKMAKQLYDYWFVQFDFPDENGRPYKSSGGEMVWNEKLKREIPNDWSVVNIFSELSVQYGFPFSTELFTEKVTNIPVVRIRDILDNSVSAYSTEEVDERYKLQKQDLLIGMDGNFHMNYWNDDVSYLNQRSVRLRAKENSTVSIMQAKYDITPYIKAKELQAKGSTVGHLSDKDLRELYVLVCPNSNLKKMFDSILAQIIKNRCEIITLTKQRDELLPLLMNGQASLNYHLLEWDIGLLCLYMHIEYDKGIIQKEANEQNFHPLIRQPYSFTFFKHTSNPFLVFFLQFKLFVTMNHKLPTDFHDKVRTNFVQRFYGLGMYLCADFLCLYLLNRGVEF